MQISPTVPQGTVSPVFTSVILTSVCGSGRPSVSARSAAVSPILVIVMEQLGLGLGKSDHEWDPEGRFHLPNQLGGHRRAAAERVPQAGQVALGAAGVAE